MTDSAPVAARNDRTTLAARAVAMVAGPLLIDGISRCPRLCRAIRTPVAMLTLAASSSLRRGVMANIAHLVADEVDPPERRRLARAMVARHFEFIVDIARFSRMTRSAIEAHVGEVFGFEHFRAARQRGSGLILLTAHYGSFEAGAAAVARLEPSVHVVFRRDPFPSFERCRARTRRTLGLVEAPIDDGVHAWLALRDALNAGGVVLMQGDLALPGQSAEEVPLLRGRARLPTGPYRLAALTGAAVVPVFAPRRKDGLVDMIIEPEIEEASRGDVSGAVARMAATLTRIIERDPSQWIMPRAIFL